MNVSIINKGVCILTILLLTFSCNDKPDNIAVKLGELNVTQYEFNRELDKFIKISESVTNREQIDSFKLNFLSNCYFIEDGYRKGYDHSEVIKNKLNAVSNFMMVQKYGYLWQETVSPIVNEYIKIDEHKKSLRKKLFYFDYIICSEIDSLKRLGIDVAHLNKLEDFNALKELCNKYEFLENGYSSLQWPFSFLSLYKDSLVSLKPGQVSPCMVFNHKAYILFLDHIEKIELTGSDLNQLKSELQLEKETEIDNQITKKIEEEFNIILFDNNIGTILEHIIANENLNGFNQNLILLKYNLDGHEKILDYTMFCDYYKYIPFAPLLNNKIKLIQWVKQYCYDEYLINEAKRLGLFEHNDFILDQKNYLNKLVLNNYLKSEIYDKINIDSIRTKIYYHEHINEYNCNEALQVSLYYFDNYKDAESAIKRLEINGMNLGNGYLQYQTLKGLLRKDENRIVTKLDHLLNENDYNVILTMKNNTVYNKTIPNQDQFVIFRKDTIIYNYLAPYNYVKHDIERELFNIEVEVKKDSLLKSLMSKQKITINHLGIKIND